MSIGKCNAIRLPPKSHRHDKSNTHQRNAKYGRKVSGKLARHLG